jgi:RNA polymerase sigma-70 factor (ECF subfamily)
VGAGPNKRLSERKTLGDVLSREEAKSRVSEGEWVRLVECIAAGDQLALHSLYETTHRIVFTLIFRITSNRETAEELTVDVFHDVWRRASGYDPADGTVLGWLMNQARCRAIDRVRFEHRKKRSNSGVDNPLTTGAENDPQQACHLAEQSRLLRKALETLTPEERQVIEIAFFSESTYQEVAVKLNQPLGTVKTRIRSGLAKLRVALAGTWKGI